LALPGRVHNDFLSVAESENVGNGKWMLDSGEEGSEEGIK
jgi:hypothetical protein